MHRIAIVVFSFVVLVVFGVGSHVYAQVLPPTCPDFSGAWTFYQQRIGLCVEEAGSEPSKALRSTGKWVFTQDDEYTCLFTARRETTDTYPDDDLVEINYSGVLYDKGTKIAMQGVPKPLWGDTYINPTVVLWGEVTKKDKKTKAPIEIMYSFNTNEGTLMEYLEVEVLYEPW
ncbi:MAG: hypothetical protein H6Q54_631 [Deltaproteobacteria bacterium]|nr:hypothetical protein [Deltaproteobacteria bacterium]